MKKMSYEEHVENLKTVLGVDPCVILGNDAKELISQYGNYALVNGGYVHKDNKIALIKPKKIWVLAHEMRHAWQYKHKDEKGFRFGDETGKLKAAINYVAGKKELDANWFSLRYCLRMGLLNQIVSPFFCVALTWYYRVFPMVMLVLIGNIIRMLVM